MVALRMEDLKGFTAGLFMGELFDGWLVREAEISGRVGSETTARQRTLEVKTGIHPAVSWSRTGKIQLNEEVTVTLMLQKDLGLFGKLRSFPVTIRARASGKSEVYWK